MNTAQCTPAFHTLCVALLVTVVLYIIHSLLPVTLTDNSSCSHLECSTRSTYITLSSPTGISCPLLLVTYIYILYSIYNFFFFFFTSHILSHTHSNKLYCAHKCDFQTCLHYTYHLHTKVASPCHLYRHPANRSLFLESPCKVSRESKC